MFPKLLLPNKHKFCNLSEADTVSIFQVLVSPPLNRPYRKLGGCDLGMVGVAEVEGVNERQRDTVVEMMPRQIDFTPETGVPRKRSR